MRARPPTIVSDRTEATVTIKDAKLTVSEGHQGRADLRVIADADGWLRFLRKETGPVALMLRRKLRVSGGSPKLLIAFGKCFR